MQNVVNVITNSQNPFDIETVPSELVNIITGQVASPEVAKSLTGFLDEGRQKHTEFMEKRLAPVSKSVSFWDPETRKKIVTFADMKKSINIDKDTKKLMIDSEVLFRRLLAVSKQRNVNMETVLQHELAVIPPALFYDDGNMRKCVKADLASKLESTTEEILELPPFDGQGIYIYDGMALLQGIHETQFNTFRDIAQLILRKIVALLNNSWNIKSVVLVFDRYDVPHSVKYQERQRRGGTSAVASHVIAPDRVVPHYRNFLKNSANKANLAAFISQSLLDDPPGLINGQSITLAGGFPEAERVVTIDSNGKRNLLRLFSTQEEADTRMLLHAIDLASSHERLIVKSDDTDVLVLLVYYLNEGKLPKLTYMHSGHTGQRTNRERFIPVHSICQNVGENVARALPSAHALTGCDSTSSLYKIGKKTAFSKLVQYAEDLPALSTLGTTPDLTENLQDARRYTLALYGNKNKSNRNLCTTLDELRYEFACKSDKPASAFPPTEDAFLQHVLRAKYQLTIWMRCEVSKPQQLSPIGNGWRWDEDTSSMQPVYYVKEAAPIEVRDLTHMYCMDAECKTSQKCHCLALGLPCTDFCSCLGMECDNKREAPVAADESDLDSDDFD